MEQSTSCHRYCSHKDSYPLAIHHCQGDCCYQDSRTFFAAPDHIALQHHQYFDTIILAPSSPSLHQYHPFRMMTHLTIPSTYILTLYRFAHKLHI